MKLIEWNYNGLQYEKHYIEMAELFNNEMMKYDTLGIFRSSFRHDKPVQHNLPISKLKKDNIRIFFLEDNTEICGYILTRPGHVNTLIDISEFLVKEEYRGRGLGTEALQQFRTWAKKNKYKHINLGVHVSNTSARTLYLNNGYKEDLVYMIQTV